jgi:hypothetical protein
MMRGFCHNLRNVAHNAFAFLQLAASIPVSVHP